MGIQNRRDMCVGCDISAPSQPSAPPFPLEYPDYPMQSICSDLAYIGNNRYVVLVDRYSNWPSVHKIGGGGSRDLIKILRAHFVVHGVAETLSSDGGPEYTAEETRVFLERWGVKHRLSSVGFPHSNQRAELAVKVIKRMVRDNLSPSGELDTDRMGKALLAYRNTPCKGIGLSPSQILYGRKLRDHLPVSISELRQRKEWILTKEARETALMKRHVTMRESLSEHTKNLPPLLVGDVVQIQNQRGPSPLKWNKSGVILERKDFDQYLVKIDGSGCVSLRNRKFLWKIIPFMTRGQKTMAERTGLQDTDEVLQRRSMRERKQPDRLLY